MIRDHCVTMLTAFSEPTRERLAIKMGVSALLEALMQNRALSLYDLGVQQDSAIVTSWTFKSNKGPWNYDESLCQILDVASNLSCSFSWTPCFSNHVACQLVKQGAKQQISLHRVL